MTVTAALYDEWTILRYQPSTDDAVLLWGLPTPEFRTMVQTVSSYPGLLLTGLRATYTVVLDSEPTSAVTVTIRGHAGTDLSLDKTVLTFTADDWDTPQTVKVTAADDAVDDPETLTHTALGGDYASLSKDLPVTITDDAPDDVMVSFGAGTYTVAEGPASPSPWGWTWTRSGPSPSSSRPRTRTTPATPTTPACPLGHLQQQGDLEDVQLHRYRR